MIRVTRGPVPKDLDGERSAANEERLKWQRHLEAMAAGRSKAKAPSFSAYKRASVRAALDQTFRGKCGYCESLFEHVTVEDIEHWRPKSAVLNADGTQIEPGYWWLAAVWENLITSCPSCNRVVRQEVAEIDGLVPTGKGIAFPVADEARRARRPGDERLETPLLLHPCTDDPERHLECVLVGEAAGVYRPRPSHPVLGDAIGRASIEVFGLNRRTLVERRRQLILDTRSLLCELEELMIDLQDADSGDRRMNLTSRIANLMERVRARNAERAEYLLVARSLIAPFLADLGIA